MDLEYLEFFFVKKCKLKKVTFGCDVIVTFYLRRPTFSTFTSIKTKYRTGIQDIETALRAKLSKIEPKFDLLRKKM